MAYNPWRAGDFLRTAFEGTPTPPRSVGILLKFLDQDDDFSASVTTNYRHSEIYNLDMVDSPLSSELSSEEDFFGRAQALLLLTVDATLATSMVAKNIALSLEKLTDAAQQNQISENIAEKFQDRFAHYAGRLGVKGFIDGTPCDGSTADKKNRFLSALGNLPGYSEDMSMDDLEDKAFPDFNTLIPGNINFSDKIAHLLPLLSQKVGFVFAALPFRARIFAFKLFDIMSCENTDALESYMTQVHIAVPSVMFTVAGHSQSSSAKSESEDGGESNGPRFLRRLATYTMLVLSLLRTIQECYKVTLTTAADGWPLASRDLKPVHFASSPSRTVPILLKLRKDVFHLNSEGWILASFGSKNQSPIKAKGMDAAAGILFLQNQMKNKDSIYRMPSVSASEKLWNDWFVRVSEFSKNYPLLSAQLIIPVLVGHIGSQDGRILGWQEASHELSVGNKQFTLSQFLSYVRELVLPTGTARKVAAKELEALTLKPFVIEDCLALSTKIQQLFRTIYPPQTGESEPITRLKAIISVHNMLEVIDRSRPQGPSAVLVKAWKAYSAYLPTEIFIEYLDEDLHKSSDASVQLCNSYIKTVVKHLGAAHRMHIQTVRSDSVDMPRNAQGTNNIQTIQHSVSGQQRSRSRSRNDSPNVNAFAGRARSTGQPVSADRSRSRAGRNVRGRGLSSGSRGSGRSNGSYSQRPPSDGPKLVYEGAELERRVRAGLEAIDKSAPSYSHKAGQFRKLLNPSLSTLSTETTFQKIATGACVLCQEDGHTSAKCPHFRSANADLRKAALHP